MTAAEKLKDLKRLEWLASGGGWRTEYIVEDAGVDEGYYLSRTGYEGKRGLVAQLAPQMYAEGSQDYNDAEFIAAMRNATPALIKIAEAAHQLVNLPTCDLARHAWAVRCALLEAFKELEQA